MHMEQKIVTDIRLLSSAAVTASFAEIKTAPAHNGLKIINRGKTALINMCMSVWTITSNAKNPCVMVFFVLSWPSFRWLISRCKEFKTYSSHSFTNNLASLCEVITGK